MTLLQEHRAVHVRQMEDLVLWMEAKSAHPSRQRLTTTEDRSLQLRLDISTGVLSVLQLLHYAIRNNHKQNKDILEIFIW